jgi:hypothetical protein
VSEGFNDAMLSNNRESVDKLRRANLDRGKTRIGGLPVLVRAASICGEIYRCRRNCGVQIIPEHLEMAGKRKLAEELPGQP